MGFNPSYKPMWSLLGLMTALLGGVLLGIGTSGEPVCGIHTIRPDDRGRSLIHEAGCSWVVQVFDWFEIEPTPGQCFWEHPDAVVRADTIVG